MWAGCQANYGLTPNRYESSRYHDSLGQCRQGSHNLIEWRGHEQDEVNKNNRIL